MEILLIWQPFIETFRCNLQEMFLSYKIMLRVQSPTDATECVILWSILCFKHHGLTVRQTHCAAIFITYWCSFLNVSYQWYLPYMGNMYQAWWDFLCLDTFVWWGFFCPKIQTDYQSHREHKERSSCTERFSCIIM